jgi:hypothetical protein
MDNSVIGKIEKAKRYAEERHRIQFNSFTATIQGDNNTHAITYKDGQFDSDDTFFQANGFSAHTIAIERLLKGMIPSPVDRDENFHTDSRVIGKIEKAKRYAEEKHRVCFHTFEATVQGDNGTHVVRYDNGRFSCDDEFFKKHGYSAHTMTMERVLDGMIVMPAQQNLN